MSPDDIRAKAIAFRDLHQEPKILVLPNAWDCVSARLVLEIPCPTNIMAGAGALTIAELEQLGVKRVTFGTGLMRATLPLIRQMAQELRASGICDSLAQTEFTHLTVNQLFKK